MLKQHHRLMVGMFAFGDAALSVLSLYLAWYLRFVHGVLVNSEILSRVVAFETEPHPVSRYINPVCVAVLCAAVLLIFRANRLYHPKRSQSLGEELLTVLQSLLEVFLLCTVLVYFFTDKAWLSRSVLLLWFGVNATLVLGYRTLARMVLKALRRRGFNLRYIGIVGAGELGRTFLEKVRAHPGLGYEVVGFFDDELARGTRVDGLPVLGSSHDCLPVCTERHIDQLYIALPLSMHETMLEILQRLQGECVAVKVIPDLIQYFTLRGGVEEFDGLPIINMSSSPVSGVNALLKRLMDLTISLVGLVVLGPLLMLPIAVLIKATSRGPVFFRQQRMGLDGRPFVMLKFRTMVEDAEKHTGPIFATPGDARTTAIGRLLRRLSLDELPQLFNVLTGDMSLVGPRPERPAFVEKFRQSIPDYMIRHRVRSGMTGLAQIKGLRGNTSIEERIKYDIYYIENWSLARDVWILFMTLFTVHKNAY
jgi:Undecaprenyl-phosphate glucose phosphotransferase